MDWLPAARRVPHGAVLPWASGSRPKGCLHTTETPGRPSYQGWTIPPHLTVIPSPGVGVDVDEHLPFTQASFALENAPGGVETNRARVYQVELVGTCDPKQQGRLYFWPEADDEVLRDLFVKVIGPMSAGLGIPLLSLRWVAFPASYGTANGVRLSGPTWLGYSGWLGHEHAAENHHGDPGLFPWDRMIQLSQQEACDMTPEQITALIKATADATREEILGATYGKKPDGSPFTLADLLGEVRVNAAKAAAAADVVQGLIGRVDELSRRLGS